jgi:hypothetical protein
MRIKFEDESSWDQLSEAAGDCTVSVSGHQNKNKTKPRTNKHKEESIQYSDNRQTHDSDKSCKTTESLRK